jgi:hypothetical protein
MLLALLAIFLLRRIQSIHDETVMAFDLVTITAQEVSKIKQFLVQQQQPQQQPQQRYPIVVDEEEIIDDDDDDDDEYDNKDNEEQTGSNIKIIILSDPSFDIVDDNNSISDNDHDIEELDDMEMDLKQSVETEDNEIVDIDETVRLEVDYRTLKLPELRKYASEHGITHVHNMKKNELLAALAPLAG